MPTRGREDGAVCDEEIVGWWWRPCSSVTLVLALVPIGIPPHHVLSRRHLDISRDVRFAR